jgi:CheY-like chemotaxis protein
MGTKILLIDDDPDDRDLFCEAVYEIDPKIICYAEAGARKALAKLTDEELDIPNIIFLDINMPGMNGWQCLSILKKTQHYEGVPVIMYSTTSHPEDIDRAYTGGALCFFTKPATFSELKKSIGLVVQHINNDSLSSLTLSSSLFVSTYK